MKGYRFCLIIALTLGCGGEEQVQSGSGHDSVGGGGGGSVFDGLYGSYFYRCAHCHSPSGPGRTEDIEQTLDFSTAESAFQTLKHGRAQGLKGNQEACNGVPFVGQRYEESLVAAVLDEDVRHAFRLDEFPGCNVDAISDMTVKVQQAPGEEFLGKLKAWINSGAPR